MFKAKFSFARKIEFENFRVALDKIEANYIICHETGGVQDGAHSFPLWVIQICRRQNEFSHEVSEEETQSDVPKTSEAKNQ